MAAAGLYQDRGLSPYHSPLAALLGSESPYTPPNAGQYDASYDEYDRVDGYAANSSSNDAFATQDTLSSCAQYLEPVLQDLGLRQWQLQGGNPVAAINGLYELVQLQQALLSSKERLQDELQKLKVDVKTADKTIQRLQCQSEQKAQEAGGLNIKLRQLNAWYREETDRWTGEREQMANKCAQMEQRHVQFQHELRRKDGEIEKLQKQLAAILSGSRRGVKGSSCSSTAGPAAGKITTSSRGGITTCSSSSKLAASNGPPDTRRATKAELEEIHKRVVEAYEADKRELLQDNAALRKALQELEREHKELLNTTEQHTAPSRTSMASAAGSMTPYPDPAAALQQMHGKLEALKVRKQRITGGGNGLSELQELQQHAQSASERLLMAKLLEASNILEEQEAALVLALKAVPGCT